MLSYPFYSIDTPYSYGATSYSDQRREPLYYRGEVVGEFEQKTTLQSRLLWTSASQLARSWTQRISLGIENREDTFKAIAATQLPIADDRSLSYPFISAQWFEDHYVKK